MDLRRSYIVFVLGAPGAGKGTLCKRLAEQYGFKHLSIGDLLRQVVSLPDADKKVIDYVQRGELLDTESLFTILKPHLEELSGRVILLDGFPRRLDQARQFEGVFGHPLLVLFFNCPKELAESRVIHRLAGRSGDNSGTFRRRHKEFAELNPFILQYYENKDSLVAIDSSGETDISYGKLLEVLQTRSEWGVLTGLVD